VLDKDLRLVSALLDGMPALAAVIDREGVIRLWNRGARELTGLPAEVVVGKTVGELTGTSLPEAAGFILSKLLAGDSWEGEVPTLDASGRFAPVHYRCSPLRDGAGNYVGLVATGYDLTERRRSEEALRSSEERLRTTLLSMPVLVEATDGGGAPLAWNAECERVTGYSAQEMIGNPRAMELLYPDPVELDRMREARARAGRSYLALESELTCKDGTQRIVSWTNISERFPIPGWTRWSMGVDVTEQRRTERDYRSAIDTSLDGFVIVDKTGRILDANAALCDLLGHDLQSLRALTLWELEVPDPTLERRGVTAGHDQARRETRYRTRDGHLVVVELSQTLADRAGGRTFMFVRDVTERRRLEEQSRNAQKMEAVGRLAGGVAHDFNNLLTAIAGYGELVLRSFEPGDDRRRDMEEIRRACDRATALTRQLLAFSRKQVLRLELVDLNTIVAELEKMLRRLLGEEVLLSTTLQPGLPLVRVDPGQIEQVLMNLAVNARDAMPRGGTLKIATRETTLTLGAAGWQSGSRPGRYVVLSVTDSGSGMDDDTRAHLFEPFFTTKEKGKGTGLGLATVYGVVTQSGGHILVETAVGQGTTFAIHLPALSGTTRTSASGLHEIPVKGGHETVLLAEDEPGVRTFAARVLREQGYHVLEAEDGVSALAVIRGSGVTPDILITDVGMPGMTGHELYAGLASSLPKLAVLYISGYAPEAIAERGIDERAETVLPKPFSAELLRRKVREVLDSPR
jgi:two-component system cell cycle sensor histidine kinase/response regulator CckA